eukprot:tig00000204_g17753.t1
MVLKPSVSAKIAAAIEQQEQGRSQKKKLPRALERDAYVALLASVIVPDPAAAQAAQPEGPAEPGRRGPRRERLRELELQVQLQEDPPAAPRCSGESEGDPAERERLAGLSRATAGARKVAADRNERMRSSPVRHRPAAAAAAAAAPAPTAGGPAHSPRRPAAAPAPLPPLAPAGASPRLAEAASAAPAPAPRAPAAPSPPARPAPAPAPPGPSRVARRRRPPRPVGRSGRLKPSGAGAAPHAPSAASSSLRRSAAAPVPSPRGPAPPPRPAAAAPPRPAAPAAAPLPLRPEPMGVEEALERAGGYIDELAISSFAPNLEAVVEALREAVRGGDGAGFADAIDALDGLRERDPEIDAVYWERVLKPFVRVTAAARAAKAAAKASAISLLD